MRSTREPDEGRVLTEPHEVHQLTMAIRDLTTTLVGRRQLLARELGMNETAFTALSHLFNRGPTSAKDLADALGLTTGATTTVIDGLIDADLATRQPNAADGRSILVTLTARGQRIVSDVYADFEEQLAVEMDRLRHEGGGSATDVRGYVAMTRRLTEAVSRFTSRAETVI